MTVPTQAPMPFVFTTLRGQHSFGDADLFLGHTLAGFPPGNLRTTVRARQDVS